MGIMQELAGTSTLFGSNAPFIEELYERYLADPSTVDANWRAYFDELRGDALHGNRAGRDRGGSRGGRGGLREGSRAGERERR